MGRVPFALSVKVLVRDGEGRCLLLRRSMSSKNNGGMWDLPGGKVDAGETFDEALLREVAEETGLEIELDEVHAADQSAMPDRIVAYLFLLGHATSGEIVLSEEHDEFRWFERSELVDVDACPQFRRVLAAYARS